MATITSSARVCALRGAGCRVATLSVFVGLLGTGCAAASAVTSPPRELPTIEAARAAEPLTPALDGAAEVSSPEAPRPYRRHAEAVLDDFWFAAGRGFDDTLRGDWDTTSALLVVYNPSWQNALERLLSFAKSDVPVYVLATPEDTKSREFARWLASVPFAGVVSIDLDTPWIRDYGPLEVERTWGISWLDLSYAPDDRPLDDAVPTLLGEVFEALHEREYLSLDGGAIISNGKGLCGMTEASLASLGFDIDNPADVQRFLEIVGCRTLARLPELPTESTGHVDMVAQFLSPHQVAIAVPTRRSPPEVREALSRARLALEHASAAHGQELSFVELPLVGRTERFYSYVNGLRTPGHYFMPSYSSVSRSLEAEARRRLSTALSGIKVVGVDSDEMIASGGAIHCVTLGLKRSLVPRSR